MFDVNAIRDPSGDQSGSPSNPSLWVRRIVAPSAGSAT